MTTPRRGDLGVGPRALPRGTRHPGGVADLGVWVIIVGLIALTAMALAAWVGDAVGELRTTEPTPAVTVATVAPAIEYAP